VTVIFEAKDKARDVSEDLKDFANSLIDHQLRVQLDKTNGKIRDLIVAHAFSPLDLNEGIKSL
jgi:His-Xaa-Ser system protein HxsD